MNALKKIITLDLRALALLRMATAFVILLDLGIRFPDLEVFYTDYGAAPRELIKNHFWNTYFFSLHMFSGSWLFEAILFSVAAFCAIGLAIGYRTRLFTFLSWVLLLSLHNRNPIILQGGDDLLRMLLFWGLFLPWGKKLSIDEIINPDPNQETQIASWATLAYLLQITYVYFTSAIEKGPEWHTDFTAMYYVYQLDQITYGLAKWLSHFPTVLKILTGSAYYFELLIPLLLFFPYKNYLFRLTGILVIIGFHTWNGLTLQIGLFFVIGICSTLGLLPSKAIDLLYQRFLKQVMAYKSSLHALYTFFTKFKLTERYSFSFINTVIFKQINDIVLMILVYYVMVWNWGNLPIAPYKMNDHMASLGFALRLDQNWGMFAPGVIKDDGWYIYEGITAKGDTIDIKRNGQIVDYAKPDKVVTTFKNDRWRKYGEQFMLAQNDFMRSYLCDYAIAQWNNKHPQKKIRQLQIIYMMEFTLPDYQTKPPTREVLTRCY